jgi:hypothetical protein
LRPPASAAVFLKAGGGKPRPYDTKTCRLVAGITKLER